jgi:hypothetical protein
MRARRAEGQKSGRKFQEARGVIMTSPIPVKAITIHTFENLPRCSTSQFHKLPLSLDYVANRHTSGSFVVSILPNSDCCSYASQDFPSTDIMGRR